MLIRLPESQRIKHDTRTIALHDHQVTFTLSSHPLAVYPVQLGAGRSKKNRPECAKARKLSSYGNSARACEGNSLMFSPRTFALPPPSRGIYLIDGIAKYTSNEFRMHLHVSRHAVNRKSAVRSLNEYCDPTVSPISLVASILAIPLLNV